MARGDCTVMGPSPIVRTEVVSASESCRWPSALKLGLAELEPSMKAAMLGSLVTRCKP